MSTLIGDATKDIWVTPRGGECSSDMRISIHHDFTEWSTMNEVGTDLSLTVDQARQLRDRLDEAIAAIEEVDQ